MSGNSFGNIFRITTFGESHGKGIGVVIDGCPAGLLIDESLIHADLQRRKPAQSALTTQRNEADEYTLLSGVYEGRSTGAPMAFFVANKEFKSDDYKAIQNSYRPSHADFTYEKKYGLRDYRGGGRSSARETIARVIAGSIAKMVLSHHQIKFYTYVHQIGEVVCEKSYEKLDLEMIENSIVRCPDLSASNTMIQAIEQAKSEGDSLGGIVKCIIKNAPIGLGDPVFDRLEADLAKAMLSINASKGFEIGSGFAGAKMKGSAHNDHFEKVDGKIMTSSNYSGGIQGGISNGMDIYFNVAFKPTSTIAIAQRSVDLNGEAVALEVSGRHDPCVVPRAVPIVEAMAALVMVDHLLRNLSTRIN